MTTIHTSIFSGLLFFLYGMILGVSLNADEHKPVKVDCTPKAYPALIIHGDKASCYPNGKPAAFRGFADPCIRRDHEQSKLWMVYSWPHMEHLGGRRKFAVGVETHLASSKNGGNSWHFEKVLWPRTPAKYINKKTNLAQDGFISHEVPNIASCEIDGKRAWVGVRGDYFLGRKGNYKARDNRSFCLRLMTASTPPKLTEAPYITFGHAMNSKECSVDINVCDYSKDFPSIFIPNEPALHYKDGRLYLAFVVMTFWGKTPIFDKNFIAVFSTKPKGKIKSWKWRYHGKLVSHEEAKELGGKSLTQLELAQARDGQLLAFLTPESWNPKLPGKSGYDDAFFSIIHHGCAVVEVASLEIPALNRRKDGSLKQRAWIFSSTQSKHGPGAPAYEPTSKTGVLYTLRNISPPVFMSWSIHPTKFHP